MKTAIAGMTFHSSLRWREKRSVFGEFEVDRARENSFTSIFYRIILQLGIWSNS